MTHLLILHEGYPDGFDRFKENLRASTYKYYIPTKKNPVNVQPKIREIRFLDIVVPEQCKGEFLSELYEISSFSKKEKFTTNDGRHKNIKIGYIKRIINTLFKLAGFTPIDSREYPTAKGGQIAERLKSNPELYQHHGWIMPLAELKDGFNDKGREML